MADSGNELHNSASNAAYWQIYVAYVLLFNYPFFIFRFY